MLCHPCLALGKPGPDGVSGDFGCAYKGLSELRPVISRDTSVGRPRRTTMGFCSSEGGASPYFLVGACRNVCVGTNGNELCSFAPFGEPVQTVAKEANFAQTFYGVADVSESTLLKHLLENPADFRLLRTSADFLKTVQYFCIVLVWLSSSYCVPPMVLLCPRSMFFRSMFGRLQVRSPSQPS